MGTGYTVVTTGSHAASVCARSSEKETEDSSQTRVYMLKALKSLGEKSTEAIVFREIGGHREGVHWT